ncbi:MAG: septum formation inhibitor Maf [Kiritimatiellae bacterium]|nr:septum formation inhibitor Maf [Kiritimatiellia bacterium]
MQERPEIILASGSPRRRELLASLGLPFRVIAPEVEELPGPGEAPEAFALRAARDKARWVADKLGADKPCIVIAGDTVVVADDRILGKPRDEEDARAMLRMLSGRGHEVITGLCVLSAGGAAPCEGSAAVRSRVTFRPLADAEIDDYIATGEPMDKAGAYAVQGRARAMIASVEGSYTNVVGLPVDELSTLLRGAGYPLSL